MVHCTAVGRSALRDLWLWYVRQLAASQLLPPLPLHPRPLQLEFLLGQTQKYSTMLAERLKGEEAAAAATAVPGGSRPPSRALSVGVGEEGEGGEAEAPKRVRRAARAASPSITASAAVSGTAGACWAPVSNALVAALALLSSAVLLVASQCLLCPLLQSLPMILSTTGQVTTMTPTMSSR